MDWENDEDVSFTLHTAKAQDGTVWIMVRCSQHGSIAGSVEWDAVDLQVRCALHYQERHSGAGASEAGLNE